MSSAAQKIAEDERVDLEVVVVLVVFEGVVEFLGDPLEYVEDLNEGVHHVVLEGDPDVLRDDEGGDDVLVEVLEFGCFFLTR